MLKLKLKSTALNHDDIYEMLVDLHAELSPYESAKADAKLIITLMNQIEDSDIIKDAIKLVKSNMH